MRERPSERGENVHILPPNIIHTVMLCYGTQHFVGTAVGKEGNKKKGGKKIESNPSFSLMLISRI